MADGEKRVLLVKPGDVLLVGNVGRIGDPGHVASAGKLFEDMGVKVVFFMEDIDIDKVSKADDL